MPVSPSRPLRAPRENGAMVAEPPLADVGRLLDENRRRLARSDIDILGRSLHELRHHARLEAVSSAKAYLRESGEAVPSTEAASLIMAGHQPELVHPGVWVKHFALNGLARRHGLTPVNLVVDNDTVKHVAIQVPEVADSRPRVIALPFDRWMREIPYEERTVLDENLFGQVAEHVPRWDFVPLLHDFWPDVCNQARRTQLLGERFAAARRAWERRWGCHNLEIPVSRLCRTETFAWFACHVLANLARFHSIYNSCVHEYRREHGIRDRSHPVPDLAVDGDWLETPFWAWRTDQPRRGRLFARGVEGCVELRVHETACGLATIDAKPQAAIAIWEKLGYKVRPRALTNTLFARLFLTDLFIHGIGGGKYDELTDQIMRRFYGIEPPHYLVLSATLLLPFNTFPADEEQRRQLMREARDLHWNPQRHVYADDCSDPALRQAAIEKRALIERQPSDRLAGRERFRMLRQLTERLRQGVGKREGRVLTELARCEEQLQANAVSQRRDYAFCLYPEQLLRPFCTQFL
jgi:hypothetical protein